MAAFPGRYMKRSHVTAWIAPAGGALAGIATAALFLLLPQAMLEDWVWQSGLPALLAVAAPPLGDTARAVLALAGGGLAAAVTWSALFLLFGAGGLFAPKPTAESGVPVLRRADAHPDAPARRPMSAADLGTPLPPPTPPVIEAVPLPQATGQAEDEEGQGALPDERSIPADLDLPLAAFHPDALPEVPREPVLPLRPPVAVVTVGPDGVEEPAAVEPDEPPAPAEVPSSESLLDRLERSTRRRSRA
jgi:hypothetical protein